MVGVLTSLVLAASMLAVPDSLAAAARAGAGSALHTEGSRIVTESGADLTIRAVNWFGLETPNCAPHGLWQISLDQAMNQIASFGFNTIRLPFSSECLAGGAVSGVDARVNPDLQGLTPVQIMDRVVAAAVGRNMRVILDRHRPDSGSQSELWYTDRFSEQQWIADWVMLATRYADQPAVIGADLHNEPHGAACWGCGNPAVDWAAAATRAGDAILAVNPRWLVIVEGIERQVTAGTTWWGGGLADVATHPITLAVPGQLVYSAHDYPSSIYPQTWFSDPAYPANLPDVWRRNWGYLQEQYIAPVLLGEFGTKLSTPSDAAWLDALVGYLDAQQMSFAYWSYNPNSGDTGGLIADDWLTPQQAKLDALASLLPGAGAPLSALPPTSSSPTLSLIPGTTSAGPTATSTAGIPVAPTGAGPSTMAGPAPQTTPSGPATTPLAPPPTPTPSPGPRTRSSSDASGSGVTVNWQLQSSWPNGYVAQLVVTAAKDPVDGWSVSWPDPHATSVSSAWGMKCTPPDGEIRCEGADWASRIAAGASVTVGVLVAGDGAAPRSPEITIG